MKRIVKKKLILSLIKDDLINTKLISGLENLGIDASRYLLGISDAIFVMMGIDDNKQGEELLEYYLELRDKKVKKFNLKKYQTLDNVALEIYKEIIKKITKIKSHFPIL